MKTTKQSGKEQENGILTVMSIEQEHVFRRLLLLGIDVEEARFMIFHARDGVLGLFSAILDEVDGCRRQHSPDAHAEVKRSVIQAFNAWSRSWKLIDCPRNCPHGDR